MNKPARFTVDVVLLTESEAADRLRLCAKTLRKERKAGRLPYVLIGRAIRYTISDLETFIQRTRQDQPCQFIAPKSRPIGNSTSSCKVIGITARLAAKANETR